MDVSQALDIINSVKQPQAKALTDLIPLELIEQAYEMTDTVTLRKRKLSLESLVWLLVGMALYNFTPERHSLSAGENGVPDGAEYPSDDRKRV